MFFLQSEPVFAQIATDYSSDASLLDNMDIYMLILANPDGYDYTHNNVRLSVHRHMLVL